MKQTEELIETLWNVNEDVLAMINNRDKGINRNIVECKLERELRNRGNKNELIETLWNVNTIKCSLKHSRKP